jgi:hypothetical protein
MRRFVYPWLALSVTAGVILAFICLRQRAEIARLQADRAEASAHDEQFRQKVVDPRNEAAAARSKISEPPSPQNRPASATFPTLHLRASDLIRDHPEYAAFQQKEMRRGILQTFGEALSNFNLPPDQLVKLVDLMVENSNTVNDSVTVARDMGLQPGTPSYDEAMKRTSESIDQQIKAIIGPDGLDKLAEAQGVWAYSSQISNEYQPDFVLAGAALTTDQARNLAQLLYENGPSKIPAAMNSKIDPETGLGMVDEQIILQAARFLSPAQIEILRADRKEQNQLRAIIPGGSIIDP